MFSESAWPSAEEAAKAVLAACMLDQSAAERATELLSATDFDAATSIIEDGFYAKVFKAVESLVSEGKRPAPALVAQRLKKLDLAPRGVGDQQMDLSKLLGQIVNVHIAGVAVEEYCRILHIYGTRRKIRMAGHKLVDLANDDRLDTADYVAQAEAIVSEATVDAGSADDEPMLISDVVDERFEWHRNRKKGEIHGLITGYGDLDDMLLGLQPGDLIILAARPAMGKTALAQNILNEAARRGKHGYLVSKEMSNEQTADRIIAAEGNVNAGMLRGATVSKEHFTSAAGKLAEWKRGTSYFIDKIAPDTVVQVRQRSLRLKRKHGLDFIVIDYLQLMDPPKDGRRGNRTEDVSAISRGMKRLAQELKVPVVALSQLSRELERREDKRPMLSDLRESGAIEQDADVVAFIYRDDYYHPDNYVGKSVVPAEIIIAKNRNGSIGTVKLGFIRELTKFVNFAE